MASTSEVGHAKNVANFLTLITYSEGFGTQYNPSTAALKIAALKAQQLQAKASINNIIPLNTEFKRKTNERAEAFAGLETLATSIVNALSASNASENTVNDAKEFQHKIHGTRVDNTPPQAEDDDTPPDSISVSQRSYDQLIEHFTGLIAVADAEPLYNPNELHLKITTLETKLADMTAKNNAIALAHFNVTTARNNRKAKLYHPETGLVATAKLVKDYVESVFTYNSPEFTLVNSVHFRTFKK